MLDLLEGLTSSLLLTRVALTTFSFTEAVTGGCLACGGVLENTGLFITLELSSTLLHVFELGRSITAGALPSRETAKPDTCPECNESAAGIV